MVVVVRVFDARQVQYKVAGHHERLELGLRDARPRTLEQRFTTLARRDPRPVA